MVDAIGLNYGIQKARENKTPRSPLVEGAWRASVIRVLQRYFLVDQFRLEESQRGFSLSSLIFSSITHILVLSCVYISLPYSLSFHFIVDCGGIWLRVVLSAHYAYLLLFRTLFKLD